MPVLLRKYGQDWNRASSQEHIGRPETVKLLFAYLEDPVISDVPFRRVQKRFPEAFKKVFGSYQDEFDASVKNVEDAKRNWATRRLTNFSIW